MTENDLRRIAATIDSGSVPPDLVRHMTVMWSGKLDSSATPQMSIKSGGGTCADSKKTSGAIIPPRAITEAADLPSGKADYELLSKLGEGGMGVVMSARQSSIDRVVAVKKIKPSEAVKAESRQKFLAEATVTGDLEHPNIVPIYDLGKDESGHALLLDEARQGHALGQGDRPEDRAGEPGNLDEGLRRRGLRPFPRHHPPRLEARKRHAWRLRRGAGDGLGPGSTVGSPAAMKAGMAGTPAYMAPEMAVGPMERIGFGSDIYLFGAILYEVVTGKRPHTSTSVAACSDGRRAERDPADGQVGRTGRYRAEGDVHQPQRPLSPRSPTCKRPIAEYCSHAESISFRCAPRKTCCGRRPGRSTNTTPAPCSASRRPMRFGNGNPRAGQGIEEATLAYAGLALKNGDFDLGAKLLDPQKATHAPLLKQLRDEKQERDARVQRLKTARRVGVALVVTVLVVVTVAFFLVNAAKKRCP